MRVLVVEDNAALADGVSRTLSRSGFAVDSVGDGHDADELLRLQHYDLVLLDLSLPGLDGLELLKRLRRQGCRVPVLVLTARGDVRDRVTGLDLGADDYLTKPFDLGELEARARALLRRSPEARAPTIVHGPLVFDSAARSVRLDGREIDIPRRELALLEILLRQAGQVISKERIAESLFSFDDCVAPNAIETYISRLRKRLEPGGVVIRTVRGLGYMLEPVPRAGIDP